MQLRWGSFVQINNHYNEPEVIKAVAIALDNFYKSLIVNLGKLNIKKIMGRKNPYLFRAKAINGASQIVDALLMAFVSSSEETIFGNSFFEPIATATARGQKALAEGIDITIENDDTIYAIAVKSGPHVFNRASKKKQGENFVAAQKLAQQVKKRFVAIVGYGYGKKNPSKKGQPKIYEEIAGQAFWTMLTGDEDFYLKLIRFMKTLPEKHIEEFRDVYQKTMNKLLREFTLEFCNEDGSIDWEKLVRFNSENLL